jgi:hypothetical protein
MEIELLTYTLEVLFCGCGCECTVILRKGGKEVATLGPMPIELNFCASHVDAMLLLQDVPEDEQTGLKVQLVDAFQARKEARRRQIEAIMNTMATPVLADCRKCTAR